MTSHPLHLAIMLTEYCNLDCYHCFRNITYQKSDLSLDVLSKLSEKLKKTSVSSVRITGGEPFLMKDIEKLIFIFSHHGLHTSIGTNGTLLCPQKIKLLKDSGLNEIWISVHSNNAETHDRLSGKVGSFYSMLNAINECIKQGINLNVNYPVSRYNIQDTLPTLKFLDDLGVNRIKLLRITPIGKASPNNSFEHIEDKEWLDLAKKVSSIKFQKLDFKIQGCPPDSINEGKCTVYSFKYMNLSPSGFVYPCCLLNNRKGMEIGDISELLNGDWEQTIKIFNERIKQKFNFELNPIPCIPENEYGFKERQTCPLYSKKINNEKNMEISSYK
jgi:MoaA/NifB/PqqE/SkfB family radical SAM enzyme